MKRHSQLVNYFFFGCCLSFVAALALCTGAFVTNLFGDWLHSTPSRALAVGLCCHRHGALDP